MVALDKPGLKSRGQTMAQPGYFFPRPGYFLGGVVGFGSGTNVAL